MESAGRDRIQLDVNWRPNLSFALLLLHFSLFGLIAGTNGVLWASLIDDLSIGEGAFGTAQLVPPLVSTLVILAYSRLTRRAGPHLLALAGLGILAAALLAVSAAGSLPALAVAFVILGLGTGVMDGAMIQGSVDWERATRLRRMNVLHAGFSGGAILGALGGGALLGGDVGYRGILAGMAVACLLALAVTVPLRYPPVDAALLSPGSGDWRAILENSAVRALMLVILLGIVVESTTFVWAVIYLREELGGSALLGGAGFAAFHGAMFSGRLANLPLVTRRGSRASLIVSGGGLLASGMLLVIAPNLALAIAALVLVGLGVAGIFPTVMSAAGDEAPGQSASLTTIMMTAAYLGFLLAPPLVGWIAELISLRGAMALIALSGAGILWLARRLDS